MKRFKFKLDGLIKVRKFKEEQVKVELGVIITEISELEKNIRHLNDSISEAFTSQEKVLKTHTNGQMLQFYPFYIQGLRADIENKSLLLSKSKERGELKRQELAKARADVKVLTNLREKKYTAYKKKYAKKELEDIEELNSIRRILNEGT